MLDNFFLAAQIRAARAVLGWSQARLSKAAQISKSTLVDLESNRRQPHQMTLRTVLDYLADAGIDLTADGVRVREWPLKPHRRTPSSELAAKSKSRLIKKRRHSQPKR